MRIAVTTSGQLVVDNDGLWIDITREAGVPQGEGDPLLAVLRRGDQQRLARLAADGAGSPVGEQVAFTAPIRRPGKVIGAPVNYLDHKIEMHEQKTIADYGVFLKAPSSVIGPDASIRLPYTDQRVDQEGELGVVLGRGGKDIAIEDALDHVFGYTCLLDITVRSGEDRSTRKSFDTFTPLGPWVVTADEIGDPGALRMDCWVGDEHRQSCTTADLIYSVPDLIAYASSVMTLEPGDVIATGTPAGVGPLTSGQRVVVEIERIGRLEVPVSDEGARPYADRPGTGAVAR